MHFSEMDFPILKKTYENNKHSTYKKHLIDSC